MPKRALESLGALVRAKRGAGKLRETARAIGIGPATLLRIESGRMPDLNTFGLVCNWLEADPGDFFGFVDKQTTETEPMSFSAHFRTERTPDQETMRCIAQMITFAAKRQSKSQLQMNG